MGNYANGREFSWSRGLLSGMVGGLVGTIVMTQFQTAWSKAAEELKPARQNDAPQARSEGDSEKEDATMKAAGKAGALLGHELSHETKKKLGPLVHYGFGTLQGAIYGTVLEAVGECGGGFIAGLAFGAALFALADEVAVPYLGLGAKASETPMKSHLYALGAHLVYGVSAEVARKGLRASV